MRIVDIVCRLGRMTKHFIVIEVVNVPVRIPWNQHEVALLIDAYLRIAKGADLGQTAEWLSRTLRRLAMQSGQQVDDTFRNVNGMKMQLANVQYLFTDGQRGLSGASAMIRQIYGLYKSNPAEYQTVLKEAIRLTGSSMSIEDAFFSYAKEHMSLSNSMLADYLQKATDYCRLKQPLLGMKDVKAVRNVQQKIAEGKLLRFRYGKDAQTIRNVTQLYYTFIKNYREPKEDLFVQTESLSDEQALSAQDSTSAVGTTIYNVSVDPQDSDPGKAMTIKDAAVIVLKESGQPLTIAEILQRIEDRKLYKFGSSGATNLYISIRRYCKGMESRHHAPVDVFDRFTDETGQIRYKLLDEDKKTVGSSQSRELSSDDERWLPILQDFFPDGYILHDFLGQFQATAFWQERYGEECPIQGEAIDAAMKAVGAVRDGRVFVKNEEDKLLIANICEEINNILSHYTTVYRSCIYDSYQEQLASIAIYTEQVMTQQLLTEAKGTFYSVNQVFAKPGKYASVIQDARKVLLDHGGPMPVDEVAKVLWFIPRDLVYHYLSVDDESLNIGNSTWMLAEHFPVTHEDAEKIGNMLDEYFLTNSYVQAFDLIPLLRDRLPSIADNLSGMTYQAVFNIVAYYLRNRFNFTKAIISPKGTSVDFTDLFRAFSAERDTFTLTDLEALASELKLPIYWESTYAGGAVRVSNTEFVNKRLIQFDVDAIDTALADFCPGDYLPLMSVSSAMMMHLPSCGYRWNGYLLQSYVFGFSKVFRLSYSSFGKTGYYGAMVRRSCKTINNYGSLIERVLTDDDTWETTADALDVLVNSGYQAMRKYKGIDNVVAQARLNKLPNDGR